MPPENSNICKIPHYIPNVFDGDGRLAHECPRRRKIPPKLYRYGCQKSDNPCPINTPPKPIQSKRPTCIYKKKILKAENQRIDSTVEDCWRRDLELGCEHPSSRQEFRQCLVKPDPWQQKNIKSLNA
jgi:hypothetical protein